MGIHSKGGGRHRASPTTIRFRSGLGEKAKYEKIEITNMIMEFKARGVDSL